ncbi:DKNYY domain-containing protein, partial [Candidatus Pacebacteria bacterium]|nr:DKNYY domain-containing protein [Candidatus Paceibacterota bacterium]
GVVENKNIEKRELTRDEDAPHSLCVSESDLSKEEYENCIDVLKETNNKQICDSFTGRDVYYPDGKNHCYKTLAIESRDASFCEEIPETGIGSGLNKRELCYFDVSREILDFESCKFAGQNKTYCEAHIHFKNKEKNGDEITKHYYKIDENSFYFFDPTSFDYAGGRSGEFSVDVKSFEIIGNFYSKDSDNVFYKDINLENADPKTFELKEIKIEGNSNFRYGSVSVGSDGFYKDEKPSITVIGVDNDGVYVGQQYLEDISPNDIKIEIGNGMGSIISDKDTSWYFKGNCHGGSYIPGLEMIPIQFETEEEYLDEYGFC